MGRRGDGFVLCGDGVARWGRFGAAGALFVVHEPVGPFVMMQKRSTFAHEGGTWSIAGGALDEFESPLDGALREATEEVGVVPDGWRLIGSYVFAPAPDWSYTTVVVEVARRFGASMNFETDAVAWVTLDDVATHRLHNGFAAAWPSLRGIVESANS
jgi:8-oxo-dGTP pyrophosphatase MutT (NUDIX family)